MEEYRYNRLTWPEMNDAIAAQKLVILPTGSTEQHGRHLPLDVDVFLANRSAWRSAGAPPTGCSCCRPSRYGLNLHHIDFPGTIHIEPETFIAFCLNITKSVAYHGFQKILLVNGHGSNTPLIDLVARKTVLETKSLCFATGLPRSCSRRSSRSARSEVMAHADEFETSLYLHLAPRARADGQAVEDNDRMGKFVSSDSTGNYPCVSTITGDAGPRPASTAIPTKATAEKGRIIFEAAVGGLVELVDELRAWPMAERADQHRLPVQSEIRW